MSYFGDFVVCHFPKRRRVGNHTRISGFDSIDIGEYLNTFGFQSRSKSAGCRTGAIEARRRRCRQAGGARTGDRGRWCDDGLLEHLGRIDSQVKVRGHRIELGEIEANLASHPQVTQAVVLVREDQPGDVRLVAYVMGGGGQPAAAELRAHLRRTLPDYMLPQHFVRVERMPLLPNGKIDRKVLPAPSESVVPAHTMQPQQQLSEIERGVAQVWQDILGVSDIRAADNFFDLGGHSLIAMRVVMEMEKRLSIRVAVRRLVFESLAQIAATPVETAIAAGDAESARPGLLSRVFGRLGRRS